MSTVKPIYNPPDINSILHGYPLGIQDMRGCHIHIGDIVQFDPEEWGSDNNIFKVEILKSFELSRSLDDLQDWCIVLKKYDGRIISEQQFYWND